MGKKNTRRVSVGCVPVGGGAPVSVQSMTNTDTRDIDATVAQIHRLEEAGCEIVRVSVYDRQCALAMREIKRQISVPLVADIHFDYRLALLSIAEGVDKLRINPGNIGDPSRVRRVTDAAKERGVPIRIGVNSGSLSEKQLKKYGGATPDAMVESAMEHIHILEEMHFEDIIIAIKASDVHRTVECYRKISALVHYPLHIGVTEAGDALAGIVKSSIGIGALLLEGIGDTLRVSLTGDPEQEIIVGKQILSGVGLRREGIEIVSCPTCGRTQIPLPDIVRQVRLRTRHISTPLKVAVMGCVVNGPGEAREADIGMAGGKDSGVIFKRGEKVRVCRAEELVDALVFEIEAMAGQKQGRE